MSMFCSLLVSNAKEEGVFQADITGMIEEMWVRKSALNIIKLLTGLN